MGWDTERKRRKGDPGTWILKIKGKICSTTSLFPSRQRMWEVPHPCHTVPYTHSLTLGMNDLGWTRIFQQKSFPPEKADKAQPKSSGEGFYSIRAFSGNKARPGQVLRWALNPLPTQPWPPSSCGHSISQLMDEPGQQREAVPSATTL
ncbi:hypothetical protein DV515_00016386 [Chloebia gouldiae]|uniref:Uncharacterized protein n=1 Tax=Chloebia gouldiae TaxID=44316 RepID=A0A3L8RSK5_CHLGU|nr:hypothetical protein DV515_00016386 [Chloebia gouldiae]